MNALDTALYATLAGGAALTTLLGGTAIYNQQAPRGADYPLVVFGHQGGGDENLTPRRMKSLVYQVQAVSADSMLAAGAVDAAIDELLHGQTLSVSGWQTYWLARERDFSYTEVTPDSRTLYHAGGQYRIRLSK